VSSLFDKRFVLVVGKGGVGRSTVAAAIAARTAAAGRKTLLLQAGARDRYASFFGSSAHVGHDGVELRPDLHAINTNPADALHEYGLMVLRFERVYKMVFENRITKYFLRAIPGLDDYSILGKAWYHVEQSRFGNPVWPTVVFDMPASGHSLSMLKIPSVITDTVPEGPLTRDARTIEALLRDPARTAVVLVTLAEEMPTREAIEFAEHFRQLGMPLSHLVINQVFPSHFPVGSTAHSVLDALGRSPGPLDSDLDHLVTHAALARSRRELNDQYLAELRRTIDAPTAELPYLFVPSLGPDDIDLLAGRLYDQFSDS